MAKKRQKSPDKRAAQKARTLRNVQARRKRHAEEHPNDKDHTKLIPTEFKQGKTMKKPITFKEVKVQGSLTRAKRWVK
jgi:hypothetical protein